MNNRTVDLETVRDEPVAMVEKLRDADWSPLLLEIQADLEADHAENIRTATSPDGTPMPELAASTIARKGHATILVETGALADSLSQDNAAFAIRQIIDDGDTKGLIFGTSRPFAAVHQHGGGRIPQRKFLGFSEERKEAIKQQVLGYAAGILMGAQ